MNLLLEARTILENAGYVTLSSSAARDTFHFEDDSLIGSVTEHRSVQCLLDNWEKVQDTFLTQHAGQLRVDPAKAWNIYTVHMTRESVTPDLASRLFDVEEDFRGTRKVARCGIRTKEELRLAMLPLLLIQSHVALTKADLTERLRERLLTCHPPLVHLLDQQLTPGEVASRLMEGQ